MGLSFRRSMKMGPIRVNLSGRGVGLSAGVRGARVSIGPRGTYVSLSAGGFQYRKRLDAPRPRPRAGVQALPSEPARLPLPSIVAPGTIRTASVEELQASSPEEALADIQQRTHRFNLFALYCCLAAAGLVAAAAAIDVAWAPIAVGLVLAAGAWPVYLWDRDRRTARLIYDVDDPTAMERFALCCAAGESLSRACSTWHVFFSVRTTDQKRNAGATSLIQRTRVHCVPGSLPHIECNLQPWGVPVGPQQLLFLPDRLLVYEGQRFAAVRYEQLDVEAGEKRFIEEDSVPSDGQIIDRTWRYVNKSGGPDRRFNNNRQLPILRYGELTIRSPSGLRIVIQCSTVDAARGAATAMGELSRLAAQDGRAASGPGLAVSPAPAVLDDDDQAGVAGLAAAVAVVLRHLAVADRRFSEEERLIIEAAIREFCAEAPEVGPSLIARIPEMRTDAAQLAGALGVIRAAPPHARGRLMELAHQLVAADGKVTPKEKERLNELHEELSQ